jgi:hypothetical protein
MQLTDITSELDKSKMLSAWVQEIYIHTYTPAHKALNMPKTK